LGFAVITIYIFFRNLDPGNDPVAYRNYYVVFNAFILIYFPKLTIVFFFLLGELTRLLVWLYFKWLTNIHKIPLTKAFNIRRGFALVGAIFAIVLFAFSYDGILHGTQRFEVRNIDISSKDLPRQFDGIKIAQVSDIHLGSWENASDVEKGIDLLMAQNADILCITGDLINVNSDEAFPYTQLFSSLHFPLGKFAILGNHDMGDYTRFGRKEYSEYNIPGIQHFCDSAGIQLLRNKHVYIKKNTDSITIIGVDNWSKRKFKRYGKLREAIAGTRVGDFKILLSHDPSHWKAEVTDSTNIFLTLSGHTHGMQFGISENSFVWSPVGFVINEWIGLYKNNEQFLYVNPGFGFLGFSGRIGIKPEITIITLKKSG
jgi:predicted MPP superfamily phosphohydrolase